MVARQVITVLVILCAAFGLAAVALLRRSSYGRKPPFGRAVPHPSQPGSMLSFVALPSFLMLLTVVRLGVFVPVVDPVNTPDSGQRFLGAPRDVDVGVEELNGRNRISYPRNTAELTITAARPVEWAARQQRVQGIRDLAWWTGVCPNYGPFTLPRLVRALRDPDPAVKGAAAIGLGSTGGNGAEAIPDLLAVRGTSVRYFDHLVAEAVLSIEHTPRWLPADECEDVPLEELERRAAQRSGAPDGWGVDDKSDPARR